MEGMIVMITVTTLIENTVYPGKGHVSEHGLSFHVRGPFGDILFDTGQSGGILQNAKQMGIDLKNVGKIAISHGHYDHAGGIRPMVESGFSRFGLYVSKGFFNPKFSTREAIPRYNGVDFDIQYLEEKGIRTKIISEDRYKMAEGIYLISGFNGPRAVEANPVFKVEKEGRLEIDDFSDETAMVLEGKDSVVVLSGCAHPGIECMIDKIYELFEKPIEAVLGGTHLNGASQKRLEEAAAYFENSDIAHFGFSHCTGEEAARFLKERLGDRFLENHTGDRYILE